MESGGGALLWRGEREDLGARPKPVVFVTGKDPRTSAGLHVYVRAHARAAAAAGFDPHVFCLAPRAGLVRTDFGLVHRVATPVRPIMGLMATAHRPLAVP